jgi:hypothetical protein
MIINGRSQDKHVCIPQIFIYFLHVILLDTLPLAFSVAVFAGETSFDVLPAYIHDIYFMSGFFSTLPERSNHFYGIALRTGTAV